MGVAFARALFAGTIWDDEYLSVRNTHLSSWSGLRLLVSTDIWSSSALQERSGYYRPVASLSYALNRFVAGNTAAAYHAGNVLLHVLVAMLVLRFLSVRKIATGSRAIACVVLFATLPLVAEPVSWIAGRYDLLGTMLSLVVLEANARRSRGWAVPFAFAFAMLSKEPFAAVPLLVFLDDVLVARRGVLREAPKYIALTAVLGGSFVLRALAHVPPATQLLAQGGVAPLVSAYVFAWTTFGRLAVHPTDLCFFHTYVQPSSVVKALVLSALAFVTLASCWWWRRAPATSAHGAVLFGVVWAIVMMVPGSLTAPTLQIIGDRYAYFPFVGATIALAGLLESLPRTSVLRLAPAALFALAGAQIVRLESRLGELQSEDSMFHATLARDPDNFTTLSLLGNVLARRGRYAEAEETLFHARRVSPMSGDIDTALSFVHLRQHRYAEAEADGWRAVASKPQNPRAWLNLASALVNQGKAASAADAATQALERRPTFAEAYFVRAVALLKLGRVDEAHADLTTALELEPNNADARAALARFRKKQEL